VQPASEQPLAAGPAGDEPVTLGPAEPMPDAQLL
jgi:hypothetical protein